MSLTYPDAMQTAVENATVGLFTAVTIALPATEELAATTLNMLDGSGVMAWDDATFTGSDGNFGTWAGVAEPITDALAVQSPKFKTTFHSLTQSAIQQLCQPEAQGAAVTLYFGFFDLNTGQPVCTPIVWFNGVIDTCTITASDSLVSVDVNVVAASEFMFLNNAGAKLNSSWHQLFFPGENGFAFVDNVDHQLPWGVSGPRPDQVTDVTNFDEPGLAPQATTLNF